MEDMNRKTMRYPKLEQTITAAGFMLENKPDEIAEGSAQRIEMNLSKMRDLDRKIKMIPYDAGSDEADRANDEKYTGLEKQADELIRETSDLLWPKQG